MKQRFHAQIEKCRVYTGPSATTQGERYGKFLIPTGGRVLSVVISCGENWGACGLPGIPWEHVSVSLPDRCPTWEEMYFVKDSFFEPNECVIQFHPPKSEYVNNHPFCLHMWKPIGLEIPIPPSITVGKRN